MSISTLRIIRIARGMTTEALAAKSGLSTRTISKIERGHTTSPNLRTLRKLERVLGVAGDQLMTPFEVCIDDES
jgi:transcriptional regulator with XRE-family HTH domain